MSAISPDLKIPGEWEEAVLASTGVRGGRFGVKTVPLMSPASCVALGKSHLV